MRKHKQNNKPKTITLSNLSNVNNFQASKTKTHTNTHPNKSKQKQNKNKTTSPPPKKNNKTSKTKQKRTKKKTFWENMSLKSNQGKIPEFAMINILNSNKHSYKINKAHEKQLKKKEKETQNKQTNKQKERKKERKTKQNKTKTQTKNNNKSKPTPQTIKQNKATNCEMKVNGATLTNEKIHL